MDGESSITKEMILEFSQMDTCCVSDAMDRLGLYAGLLGIHGVLSGKKICGPAFTVRYLPCGIAKGTVGDFLDDVELGKVVVIDNGGRMNCTVWGDLMSLTAKRNGVAGTVIDGVCRDLPVVRKIQYPIFSKGTYMVTGKDRVQVDAVNVPVSISNIQVKPGDLILGDDSGVICIPHERAAGILEIAKGIAEKEAVIEQYIAEGKPLKEARKLTGYHHLQTHNTDN